MGKMQVVELERHIHHANSMIVDLTDVLIRSRRRYRMSPTPMHGDKLQSVENNICLYKRVASSLKAELIEVSHAAYPIRA